MQCPGQPSPREVGPQRGLHTRARQLGREQPAGQVAQCLQRGVRRGDEVVEPGGTAPIALAFLAREMPTGTPPRWGVRRARSPPPWCVGPRHRPRDAGPGRGESSSSGRARRRARRAEPGANVVERHGGLVGQRLEQAYVGGPMASRPGQPGCSELVPAVRTGTSGPASSSGPGACPILPRPAERPERAAQPHPCDRRPGSVRRPRAAISAGEGCLGDPAAEVRERLVGLGARAVRQPVGQPDDLAPQRLERDRDQAVARRDSHTPGPLLDPVPTRTTSVV